MSILVFADHNDGKINKSSLEAVSYASSLAVAMGTSVVAVTTLNSGAAALGAAGAGRVLVHPAQTTDSQQLTRLVVAAVKSVQASVVVFAHDIAGKMVAPRVAARLNAGYVPGVTSLADLSSGFAVKKNVFSGKAIATVQVGGEVKVITVLPNSFGVKTDGAPANPESFEADLGSAGIKVREVRQEVKEGIPLPEAELVVSAGRGMKGPENWGMVEELAKVLGATTACSRPVSDMGWRPHHEHVGQTGITIRPNLYIAIGISGAIQHLAGVNGSKTIVVINTDAEAPFFKAADYGIVGDAFEVLPKLIEAARTLKAAH